MAGETTSRKDSSNNNKVRKSRSEMIKSTLGTYLKSRNYMTLDKFRKSDLVLSQSAKEFIFNRMIEQDTSRVNSFLYSNVLCLTNHYNTVEQHFGKFIQFVENQPQVIKEELSELFAPMIGHIYIELLKGREWKPACDFLRNHAKLVAPVENLNAPLPSKINGCSVSSNFHDTNDTNNSTSTTTSPYPTATTQILFVNESTGNPARDYFKEIIRTLSICLRYETLENFESLILFRSSKYEVEISLDGINALRRFLENQGHVIILNILNTWIHFTIRELQNDDDANEVFTLEEEEKEEDIEKVNNNTINNKCENLNLKKIKTEPSAAGINPTQEQQKIPINIHLLKLKHTMKKFENFSIPEEVIRIFDPDRSISNVAIDSGKCHMVAAFQNSCVKLWQLNRSTFSGRHLYERIHNRICDWAIINNSDIEDDDNNTKSTFSKEQEIYYAKKCEENSFDDNGGVILYGHTKGVTDCMFSGRFPLLFTTSKDCTMRIWQSKNYKCAAIYKGHNYPVWCVNESPIGSYLATGSRDYTARLWTIDREFPLITYVGHTQDVDCVAFHPNGNYLATGSCDSTIRLWSLTSGKLSRVFTGGRSVITCIAFSPDGKYLAAAGEESKVQIFDLAAGSQIIELKDHTSSVSHITWNSSGNRIASCYANGNVSVWDITRINPTSEQVSPPLAVRLNKAFGSVSLMCNHGKKVLFGANDEITVISTANLNT